MSKKKLNHDFIYVSKPLTVSENFSDYTKKTTILSNKRSGKKRYQSSLNLQDESINNIIVKDKISRG